jgi:5-aminolevulinate synthase
MSFNYDQAFDGLIDALHDEGRYRIFTALERPVGKAPRAIWHCEDGTEKEVTVWCSNDYLGMSHHPAVLRAMHEALEARGGGAGGTRNISGHSDLIEELQNVIAQTRSKEAALLFTSGYVANETALSTIAGTLPNCVVFSDAGNHASMIHGISCSKATKHVFRHNDPEHLRDLLMQTPAHLPKLVAFESVYSMSGDFGKLETLLDLAHEFGAITFLDETHAVGLYGNQGGGLAQELGLLDKVDILQGGLGKGYGIVGGFIAGSHKIVDVVRSYGRGFIYTTSLPPVIAAGALASVSHLAQSSVERKRQRTAVKLTKDALNNCGFTIHASASHIIPLMIGDSVRCKQISEYLLHEEGVYLQPINFPTVARGTERLRITPTPFHTKVHVDQLVAALRRASEKFAISEAA